MLRPVRIIATLKATTASVSRCLILKETATTEREARETPVIRNIGRSANHVDTGILCNASQAVQRSPIAPQLPLRARAAFVMNSATAALIIPIEPTAIAPAARNLPGMRSQASAAQSASALHMLIE